MAKLTLTIKDNALSELADALWQGGRPEDPLLVEADPAKGIEEVKAPPLSDEECVKRWLVRELKTRLHQWRREKAAKAASDAVGEPTAVE